MGVSKPKRPHHKVPHKGHHQTSQSSGKLGDFAVDVGTAVVSEVAAAVAGSLTEKAVDCVVK